MLRQLREAQEVAVVEADQLIGTLSQVDVARALELRDLAAPPLLAAGAMAMFPVGSRVEPYRRARLIGAHHRLRPAFALGRGTPRPLAATRSGKPKLVPMTSTGHVFEEHRGELEVRLEAPSLAELFAEAGRALREVMGATPLDPPERWEDEVVVKAIDRESLLVEWLNQLVLRAEVSKALFTDFEIEHLSDRELVATVRGTRVARLRNPVKAATYHGLSIAPRPGGFTARVILDV